jgi:Kef-type K+ transport system membrane component KefB
MSTSEFGTFSFLLLLLLATAQLCGYLFTRLRQPRVAGEILAGLLLGPTILGRLAPSLSHAIFPVAGATGSLGKYEVVLSFLYNLGLLLLMFASGAETKGLFSRENRREVIWLGSVGTILPFLLALLVAPLLPLGLLAGSSGQRTALVLVIGIAVAVTSIPVISKILHDLRILHTRFARLILGVAVLEDVVLWAVLAVATALAARVALPLRQVVMHVLATLVYFGIGLLVLPAVLRRVSRTRWNPLARTAPIAYIVAILLAYTALAAALDVSLVFAAFLAGFGVVVADLDELKEAIAVVSKISFSVFIPVYFAVVGYRLDLKNFPLLMLVAFLILGGAVKLLSAGLGARLAGFGWLDSTNLAITLNARGGPGIVLASVAYDAGIINAQFYTTLVLVAVLTSQAAGAWLDFVLRRGWPLLSPQGADTAVEPASDAPTLAKSDGMASR